MVGSGYVDKFTLKVYYKDHPAYILIDSRNNDNKMILKDDYDDIDVLYTIKYGNNPFAIQISEDRTIYLQDYTLSDAKQGAFLFTENFDQFRKTMNDRKFGDEEIRQVKDAIHKNVDSLDDERGRKLRRSLENFLSADKDGFQTPRDDKNKPSIYDLIDNCLEKLTAAHAHDESASRPESRHPRGFDSDTLHQQPPNKRQRHNKPDSPSSSRHPSRSDSTNDWTDSRRRATSSYNVSRPNKAQNRYKYRNNR